MTYFEDVEIKFDKKTKKHVLIQRFADGTEAKTVLDARTKYFSVLKEELRKEHNEERKHRYWVTASLEGFEYEGDVFADNNTPVSYINLKEEEAESQSFDVMKFYELLTETQMRRLSYRLENPKVSFREIAKKENTSAMAICKTFNQIKKLFENFKLSGFTN